MKTAGYTPGPWKISAKDLREVVNAAGLPVTFCPQHYTSAAATLEEAEANARLIAAAPELLEILEQCITEPGAACFAHDRKDYMIRRLNAISEMARAAIANAKGGTP